MPRSSDLAGGPAEGPAPPVGEPNEAGEAGEAGEPNEAGRAGELVVGCVTWAL